MRKPTVKEDAFGAAMWDYYRGLPGNEIVERDDGGIEADGGPRCYLHEFDKWGPHEQSAIALARGRVLDIGCGAGRVGVHLQQKGLEVVGIDNSPLAVRVCRKRGLKRTHVMSITQIGPKLGRFDTLVMFGNNFGLFGNLQRARRLLRRFWRLTNPGAQILAESRDIYPRPGRPGLKEHLDYHRRNRRCGRMAGQVRIRIRYRRHCTPWFDYLLVSPAEMREIVKGTGWKVARLFKTDGPGYVAVLRRLESRA